MNSYRRMIPLFGLLALSATTLLAQGQKRQQAGAEYWFKIEKELGLQTRYSVDMEIQAMGMVMPSKTYRLGTQMRTETTMPLMNLRLVALEIEENGKPVSYSLFPDKKKYCVNTDEQEASGTPGFKIAEAGTEVYEGVTCKKRHITVTPKDAPAQEMDMLFSPAQKNMPVKMTATAKVETEPGQPPMELTSVVLFKNYQFKAPDASLFTIPKDYTQAKDMNEIMLGSLGGFGLPQQPAAGQGQAGAAAGQPDLAALLRQAQEQAAKEAAKEGEQAAPAAQPAAANPDLQQGLQNLRKLFGN